MTKNSFAAEVTFNAFSSTFKEHMSTKNINNSYLHNALQ